MRKIRILILVSLIIILLIGVVFLLVKYLSPKFAGIYIESNPTATVYIDGLELGRTPYEDTRKQGEIIIKLVPDSFETPLAPYETKVNLIAGVQTVIKRDFGATDETSSGEIISFEKIEGSQTSLAVVSIPDSSELIIDGKERAFTPHRTSSLLPGEHFFVIRADNYQEKKVDVKTHEGYKLTAVVKLAKSPMNEDQVSGSTEESEIQEEEKKIAQKVKISSTPTGYLRVRGEPSTLGQEVGKVEPEKLYDLLETDEKTGWFKIRFEEEKEGWISNQYAEVIESAKVSPTPTPTAKPTVRPTLPSE
ncbi:PEGA domain-containing protein [Patescibacteria group bacterium]|nr:PEGA domain-containing protein [Patescibacteria group bacterium]